MQLIKRGWDHKGAVFSFGCPVRCFCISACSEVGGVYSLSPHETLAEDLRRPGWPEPLFLCLGIPSLMTEVGSLWREELKNCLWKIWVKICKGLADKRQTSLMKEKDGKEGRRWKGRNEGEKGRKEKEKERKLEYKRGNQSRGHFVSGKLKCKEPAIGVTLGTSDPRVKQVMYFARSGHEANMLASVIKI